MRWVTARTTDGDRAGLVRDSNIHLLPGMERLVDLLGDDGTALADAAARALADPIDVIPLAGADLAAPLRPPQIRDFVGFLDHLRNVAAAADMDIVPAWSEIPGFYFSNAAAVIGPFDPVEVSPGCLEFDFELEVAAVVGRTCGNLDPDDADSVIAGFMIYGDWSARDIQRSEMTLRLGPAKGKDGANTLGPMLVTPDELEPFRDGGSYDLEMACYVNDERIGGGNLKQMSWSWGEMLAYASRGTELRAGDVFGSGTVPTGCLLEQFAKAPADFRGYLEPDDVVVLEVEQLGLTRQVIRPSVQVRRLRTGF